MQKLHSGDGSTADGTDMMQSISMASILHYTFNKLDVCVSVWQPPTSTGVFDLCYHICIRSAFEYKCAKETLWQIDVLSKIFILGGNLSGFNIEIQDMFLPLHVLDLKLHIIFERSLMI